VYLRELFVLNNGSIEKLHLELPFAEDGKPIPLVMVGQNGSGKTNVLSMIAEALLEAASQGYSDITPGATILSRNWLRVIGSRTIRYRAEGSFVIMRFHHDNADLFFWEKAGEVPTDLVSQGVPPTLFAGRKWDPKNNGKGFDIGEDQAGEIFDKSVCAYFPATRAEYPYWLNRAIEFEDRFAETERIVKRLGRPIYIEQALDKIAQWLMGVMTDYRADVVVDVRDGGVAVNLSDPPAVLGPLLSAHSVLDLCNILLKTITGCPGARFVWLGRRGTRKIGFQLDPDQIVGGLNGLSGGQASLLAVFGTILRYGDEATSGVLNADEISGIVVIDELDAHMHIDLQISALPRLINMFPKIQFILTSHSPLLGLGLENELSAGGVSIVELPTGTPVSAEAYQEFGHALKIFKETKAFGEAVAATAYLTEQPIVWLAGQTDLTYFEAAARILGYSDLLEPSIFRWIGEQDSSGNVRAAGDSAIDKALTVLKLHRGSINRKIIFVYDCDAEKTDENLHPIYTIAIPRHPENTIAERGIENLLPQSLITPDLYKTFTEDKHYGESVTRKKLDKTLLSERTCEEPLDPDNFGNFVLILDKIRQILVDVPAEPEVGSPTGEVGTGI
jgi:hypothetical protein